MAVGLFIMVGPLGPPALVDVDPASLNNVPVSTGVFFSFHFADELTIYALTVNRDSWMSEWFWTQPRLYFRNSEWQHFRSWQPWRCLHKSAPARAREGGARQKSKGYFEFGFDRLMKTKDSGVGGLSRVRSSGVPGVMSGTGCHCLVLRQVLWVA